MEDVAADSLWMKCFYIIAEENRKKGVEVIKFSDVDDLVLAKSKLPPWELSAWLHG
jgi:hypothetical protein